MAIFFQPEYLPMWTALGTMFQGTAAILAIAALIYSMTRFRKALENSNYTELDSMYADLLKVALDKPHLNNPAATRCETQKMESDVYAFMVWNFLEAIYDRSEHNEHLCRTWYPVLIVESRRHREWFDDPENHDKFKAEFHEFVQDFRSKHG